MIADVAAEIESKLAMQERAKEGRRAGGDATPEQKAERLEATASSKRSKPPKKDRTRAKTAKAAKVSDTASRLTTGMTMYHVGIEGGGGGREKRATMPYTTF